MKNEFKCCVQNASKGKSETAVETVRIKQQLLRRISNAVKECQPQNGSMQKISRIPKKLLMKRFDGNLVVDVILLRSDHVTHLIVNSEGHVLLRQFQKCQNPI